MAFFHEHVVVLADLFGGFFGRDAFCSQRAVVQKRERVVVQRVRNADGIDAAVQELVQLLDVSLGILHAEESFNLVGRDIALGDDHRFHEVERNFFAVRSVEEDLFDFFAHELGIVAERFGEVLRCCRLNRLVEVRRDNG